MIGSGCACDHEELLEAARRSQVILALLLAVCLVALSVVVWSAASASLRWSEQESERRERERPTSPLPRAVALPARRQEADS